MNRSDEPIYQVIVSRVAIQGGAPRDGRQMKQFQSCIAVMPPGSFYVKVPSGGHGMMTRFALEVAFTDAAGRHWVRQGTGKLIQINQSPVQYYGLHEPVGWRYLTDVDDSSRAGQTSGQKQGE